MPGVSSLRGKPVLEIQEGSSRAAPATPQWRMFLNCTISLLFSQWSSSFREHEALETLATAGDSTFLVGGRTGVGGGSGQVQVAWVVCPSHQHLRKWV